MSAAAVARHDPQTPESVMNKLSMIVDKNVIQDDSQGIKEKEQAVLDLGKAYFEAKKAKELASLITSIRPFLKFVSRAKAARIVRTLVDYFLDLEAGTGQEIDLCMKCIEWAQEENRTFLRQALEARLMALYFENEQYSNALKYGSTLLLELKKLDDKVLLVEVQLLESQVYHRLGNLQRARAALTSARTTANGIYCPPRLQASLDFTSGVLHCADERDFKTAYSYFYEAFEGFDSISSNKAINALKYMLLCKIMMNSADEVPSVLTGKLAMKYSGLQVEIMKDLAKATNNRSLSEFLKVKEKYDEEIKLDSVLYKHLENFYDTLLGRNLLKLIEPYSRVQINHIANLINLPLSTVEKKLSQMILDKALNGILDQGTGVLVINDECTEGEDYEYSLDAVHNLGTVIDHLFRKAKKLT